MSEPRESTDRQLTFADTSRFVTTPGWRLHYHEAGAGGTPVVFLHGSGPGATGWSNFHLNIETLAKQRRVLLLDQPGWGDSDPLEQGVGGHIEAIREFLEELGLERVSLVGNSLGAVNAIGFAMTYPERVHKLVTLGAPDLSRPNIFTPAGFTPGLQSVYAGYSERTYDAYRRLVDVMTFGDAFLDDALIRERLEGALRNEHHLDAFLARAELPPSGPEWTSTRLAAIGNETLLIHGRDDLVVPFESTLRLLSLLPRSRALVFNQCGHWAQLERADEVNAAVAEFLS